MAMLKQTLCEDMLGTTHGATTLHAACEMHAAVYLVRTVSTPLVHTSVTHPSQGNTLHYSNTKRSSLRCTLPIIFPFLP